MTAYFSSRLVNAIAQLNFSLYLQSSFFLEGFSGHTIQLNMTKWPRFQRLSTSLHTFRWIGMILYKQTHIHVLYQKYNQEKTWLSGQSVFFDVYQSDFKYCQSFTIYGSIKFLFCVYNFVFHIYKVDKWVCWQ